ncbi:hypothetical protein WALSEDRAFT_63049 [Wallemia mellicola CBS 633.66]|uniref:Tubulin-specific chaperone A n=2 Tax=Wallemia mellicola TaxID=1708541 RepID=A0A4T0NF34_9BASI|nr:hypothetical protein WALSEDRAFT_63049 [Wallemia mellicola CBS 633.66]TIB71948.1 hypothetical protein E3Q23_03588 [Wallemia mellicola]EIM23027.1 hypothetical protein WALSEDRAFT_63049 [Wallemia mellicola CBS 633.66]TIB85415.1 hypothetical protein E3Q21_01950 [Wallemia mellicola]TIB88562.1 hypothetical protein E3Q20_01943 [Wallemia mellicola]TIB94506.1 hypothetical protein E3Q19_00350 [Wallemia mellicola]|eukprot:XP_006957064.1 hypothetical protein WALSEDRAFT_63049 [Wallemia mellicola CBS 633.66]
MENKEKERQIKIREGVVKRLTKELEMYKQEVVDGEETMNKISLDDENGQWKKNNQSKLIEESKKLVIDTEQRLTKAIDELEKIKC